jgi:hypothetical protein
MVDKHATMAYALVKMGRLKETDLKKVSATKQEFYSALKKTSQRVGER